MGISNFFDNFMGGLAFGMLAGFSFGRWGGGYCGFSFPMMNGFGFGYQNDQFNCLFDNSFQNSLPGIDFSSIGTSIWDITKKSMDDYNKRVQAITSDSSIPFSNPNQQIQFYSLPFSGYYLPGVQSSYLTGYNPAYQTTVKSNNTDIVQKRDTVQEEDKIQEPDITDAEDIKTEKVNNNYSSEREFAAIYQNLGITDKRFQKIFEECVLSINEGRKKGQDYHMFDVKAMNKNGILQTTYDDYRVKEKHLPKRDVKNMTLEEMCDIYYTMFYVKGGAKDIKDDRLALYVFDSDVNMGVGTGKTLLARSGNNARKFEEERRLEYSRRKNFNKYKNTWYNRIENTKAYADRNFSAAA